MDFKTQSIIQDRFTFMQNVYMECKHCKYQNSEEFNHPIIDKSVNKDYIYIDIVEGKLHVECELDYNSMLDSAGINYCPMCGRDLKG